MFDAWFRVIILASLLGYDDVVEIYFWFSDFFLI